MATNLSSPVDTQSGSKMSTIMWAVITAVLALSFIVIPGYISLVAGSSGLSSLGLTWFDTYFALPMIPAVVLGAIGVWTALRDIDMDEGNVGEEIHEEETGLDSFTLHFEDGD